MPEKQVIGEPLIINGRELSLSRAIRAGDFVFCDWPGADE